MSVFLDSSTWFAALVERDHHNPRAKELLRGFVALVTTDYVLVETWLLINSRHRREAAERFWSSLRAGAARVEKVLSSDLETAWNIGESFPDQTFSIVDRTSFAVMERLGINRVASFDDDFAVYRYAVIGTGPLNSSADGHR